MPYSDEDKKGGLLLAVVNHAHDPEMVEKLAALADDPAALDAAVGDDAAPAGDADAAGPTQ